MRLPVGLLIAELLLATLVNVVADRQRQPANEPPLAKIVDWSGIYRLVGTEGDNKYYGSVTVSQKKGQVYHVETVFTDRHISGVGLAAGDRLSIGWSAPYGTGKTAVGVSVYNKTNAGAVCHWAVRPADGAVNREDLTYLGKVDDE